MIKIFFALLTIFITACSFKTVPNQWQIKSTTAFNSYSQNFLKANDILANNDLKRAIRHAKQSADLTQLGKIYLGKCALNISAGIKDECSEFNNISSLIHDKTLDAYLSFITLTIKQEQIEQLPKRYKVFANLLIEKNFQKANKELFKIKEVSSSLLCASLIKENLESTSRKKILKLSSFYGYKKIVLFWLHESKKYAKDKKEREKIEAKISVLTVPIL